MPLDQRIYLALLGTDPSSTLTLVMRIFTWIGNGWTLLGLVPLFFFPHTRRVAARFGVVILAHLTLVWAIKRIVQRPRPFLTLHTNPISDLPTDFSFPSGHASGAFAFAMFVVAICIHSPKLRGRYAFAISAVLLAIGICVSRVYLGVHYPGDVLGGAIVGGSLGFAGGRWHSKVEVAKL